MFAKWLEKLRRKGGGTWTRWSPSGIVYEMMAVRTSFSWPEMECLECLPGDDWEEEDDDTCYSDEEEDGEVDPTIASKGRGECSRVQLSKELWGHCVPACLLDKYKGYLCRFGGWGGVRALVLRKCLIAWWKEVP